MVCTACGTIATGQARFCPGCGAVMQRGADAPRDLRVVTVLSARLGNDDDFAAVEAEIGTSVLDSFYQKVGDAVGSAGGVVDHFAGSLVAARFGAPITREDDPQCAASAARRLAAGVFPLAGGELRPSVGLATGVAVCGLDVRPGGAGRYTVRGEVVEASRRLAEQAEPGEVLADEETVQRASELYGFEPEGDGSFRLKAGAGPVQDLGPIFGRLAEKLKLEGVAVAAVGGAVQVVSIVGLEGLGKSRLAGEVWLQLRGRVKAKLIVTRAASFHGDKPYRLVAGLIEAWATVRAPDAGGRAEQLRQWAAELGRPDPSQSAAHLAWLLGDSGTSPEGVARAELTAIVLAAARRFPLVLAFEDLQRADSPSLSWIQELLSAVAGESAQLVIVLTATEPIALPTVSGLEMTAIFLKPLAPEAATALFCSRLGLVGEADSWPSALRGLAGELARKAGGNPFFLTELLRTVISRGTLTRTDDHWAVSGSLASLELPPTLKGSVAAKLDRLVPAARRLLGIAAALEGPFDLATLTILAQGDAEPGVRLLAGEGLLDTVDPAGTRFSFVQDVFRDAAYQTLLPSERASIHARIAAYIQSSFGELQEEYSGVIADHLTKAGDVGKALPFAYRAAVFAGEGGAAREAVRRYRQCLDLHERITSAAGPAQADATVRLPSLLASLVEAEERLGNYQEAVVHSNLLLAQDLDEKNRLAALRRLGSLQEQRGNFDDALAALRQGLELAGKRGSASDQAALLSQMGTIELRRGVLDEAVRLGESALNVLGGRTEQNPEPVAYAHSLIGIAFYRMGEWEKSIDHHRKALMLREEARDAFGIMRSLNNLGNTYVDFGRFDQAEKLYRQALGMARKENAPPALAQVLNNLGHLQMLRGQFEFAERHFAEAIALYEQIKDERSLGIALVNRGLAQIEQRRFEDARSSLAEGHRRLEAIGFYEQHVDLLLALSRLAAEEGDEAGAWQFLQQAQFQAGETRHPHLSGLVQRAMGEFFLRTGRIGPAIAALETAAKTHGIRSRSLEGARTQRELARALAADGRNVEAEVALEAARRCLEGLDVPSDLAELGVKA